jgi:PAS domain S-box-containing protein
MNLRDIEQQQKQKRAPVGSVARTRCVDDTPAMVWTARPDLSCEYLSRPWLEFTGYTPEQALGHGWSRGVHPEDLARWLEACVRAFDAREPFEVEYRLRRHDGEFRWMLDRGVPRYATDGTFLGYMGTCIDIEERKRAECGIARSLERERKLRLATEETSRLKEGFLASVLEDLQSPVNAVVTWTAHLRQQVPDGSEAAHALDAIERNARTQRRIIASLVDLSRVCQGKPAQTRRRAKQPLLNGLRILVVDGDTQALENIVQVLQIAGAEVRGAGDAAEALDTVASWRPDLMLSDTGMRAEGHDLIRAVRALPAELGGCLRAAALTTLSGGDAGGARAVPCGYDAQLLKPVEPVALLATVLRLTRPADV